MPRKSPRYYLRLSQPWNSSDFSSRDSSRHPFFFSPASWEFLPCSPNLASLTYFWITTFNIRKFFGVTILQMGLVLKAGVDVKICVTCGRLTSRVRVYLRLRMSNQWSIRSCSLAHFIYLVLFQSFVVHLVEQRRVCIDRVFILARSLLFVVLSGLQIQFPCWRIFLGH